MLQKKEIEEREICISLMNDKNKFLMFGDVKKTETKTIDQWNYKDFLESVCMKVISKLIYKGIYVKCYNYQFVLS